MESIRYQRTAHRITSAVSSPALEAVAPIHLPRRPLSAGPYAEIPPPAKVLTEPRVVCPPFGTVSSTRKQGCPSGLFSSASDLDLLGAYHLARRLMSFATRPGLSVSDGGERASSKRLKVDKNRRFLAKTAGLWYCFSERSDKPARAFHVAA